MTFALLVFAPGQFDFASAQSTNNPNIASTAARDRIEQGRLQLQQNNYAEAGNILTQVIINEHTPPNWMAIAFFYRGIANRMNGQNQAAIADFINALWLETLPEPIRAQAYYHRAHAYAAMNNVEEALSDLDQAAILAPQEQRIASARNELLAAGGREITGSTSTPEDASNQPVTTQSLENTIGNALNSNSSNGAAPAQSGPGTTTTAPARQVSLQPETGTQSIRIQLGALGSQAVAEAEWQRISRTHGDVLSGLTPFYEVIMREGKSMVRLRAGPAASMSSARNLCSLLKGRGQDCITIVP